jgi:hypothetical protein
VKFEKELRRELAAEAQANLKKRLKAERESARAQLGGEVARLQNRVEEKDEQLGALRRRAATDRKRLEERLRGELERKQRAKERQLERTVETLREQNEALERRVERLSAQDRGDQHEVDVLGALTSAFPVDELKRRGKACDILHTVYYNGGRDKQRAGLIVYECKDTLQWRKDFITQIKRAGQRHKTRHLVVVSKAFPRRERWMCIRDGVVVVHPAYAVYVAEIVRRIIIEGHRAGLSAEGQAGKTARLYEYLASDDFRQTFDSIVDVGDTLSGMLKDERSSHERTWTRREQAYGELARKTAAIDESIRTIIESTGEDEGKVVRLAS